MEKLDIFTGLREKAKKSPRKIVLPEGDEKRIIESSRNILKDKIARLILFGNEQLKKIFKDELASGHLEIINVGNEGLIEKYASLYFKLRKHKGMDFDTAKKIIQENPVYIAALMVREGLADGFVAGASLTTRDVARASIHCIGKIETISTVLGIFVMKVADSQYGEKGVFVFADCAVVPQPDSIQLADIAVSTADFVKEVLGIVPRLAMLSYSTKGSGRDGSIDIVTEATKLVKTKYPQLLIDGELQADAAIVPEVAALKAPESKVAGCANVLIFPNLEAANCSYKLVQRLAGARAVGPIFLGLAKPASDLSRGCSAEDIVDAVAITGVRAQEKLE